MGQEQDMTLHKGGHVLLARNGYLELSVKDSGAGMTKSQLDQLFKSAGVQFNANKLQGGGGTGLGLFISKGIMEQHGGTLTVDSDGLDMGTTFTMTVPMYLDANAAVLEKESSLDHSVTEDIAFQDSSRVSLSWDEEEAGPLYVLAVDDSISNLKLMTRLLERRGHIVVGAENGQEALDKVKESDRPFDVIAIDHQMPIMDGPTAVMEMRAIGCDSFIVGVTGNVLPDDVALFKSKGANAVLAKPFRIAELEQLQVEHSIVARAQHETSSKVEFQIQMGDAADL
jgi:two-component system, sensor histidine kinase